MKCMFKYVHFSKNKIKYACKDMILRLKWEVPIKVWDQYQRRKNEFLGPIPQITSVVIPEQHFLSFGIEPEIVISDPK